MAVPSPMETTMIGGSLEIPRMISGLWQLAGGHDQDVDIAAAAQAMDPLISVGLTCFDMADHYGDAELVVGKHNTTSDKKIIGLTKWCPAENGVKNFENAAQAVNLALSRMNQKQIALMQYHIWDYTDNTYIHNLCHLKQLQQQGKIAHIGLTNTDSAHLELLIDSGFKIATNQVSCSVIDRRVNRGRMSGVCLRHGVGILAYGTLLGGYLSEKWVDQPEPTDLETLNWSLRKYLRFIHAAGGWHGYQGVLQALDTVAKKHEVSIAAVATRWVLDVPGISAVIVGTRLSSDSGKHTASNLAVFLFKLEDEDRALIEKAQANLKDIPGDCGDEYRRPPFLTASGDLSHHLLATNNQDDIEKAIKSGKRIEYSSGSPWEPIAGYCRAVRFQNRILVSGTTANSPLPTQISVLGGKSARSQSVAILDIITKAVKALGGKMSDVVRTRVLVEREADVEAVSKVHGHVFGIAGVRPANMLTLGGVVGEEYLVEIEVEAIVGAGEGGILKIGEGGDEEGGK